MRLITLLRTGLIEHLVGSALISGAAAFDTSSIDSWGCDQKATGTYTCPDHDAAVFMQAGAASVGAVVLAYGLWRSANFVRGRRWRDNVPRVPPQPPADVAAQNQLLQASA